MHIKKIEINNDLSTLAEKSWPPSSQYFLRKVTVKRFHNCSLALELCGFLNSWKHNFRYFVNYRWCNSFITIYPRLCLSLKKTLFSNSLILYNYFCLCNMPRYITAHNSRFEFPQTCKPLMKIVKWAVYIFRKVSAFHLTTFTKFWWRLFIIFKDVYVINVIS